MTNQELKDYIELEGLGYSIQSGISPYEIDDPFIAELWKDAASILEEIEVNLDVEYES